VVVVVEVEEEVVVVIAAVLPVVDDDGIVVFDDKAGAVVIGVIALDTSRVVVGDSVVVILDVVVGNDDVDGADVVVFVVDVFDKWTMLDSGMVVNDDMLFAVGIVIFVVFATTVIFPLVIMEIIVGVIDDGEVVWVVIMIGARDEFCVASLALSTWLKEIWSLVSVASVLISLTPPEVVINGVVSDRRDICFMIMSE
jgi:hypothetical protein